jgi:anti-anti-sigma factor
MEPVEEGAHATIRAVTDDDGTFVICLGGELDISNVPAIEGELATLVIDAKPPVTFDLSSLAFMDSSGIAMLLRVVESTGPVLIRKPSRIVQQIIDATGLADILQVVA